MRAGELRHRIILQSFLPGVDEEGYPSSEWQDVATVWASVENLSGREFWQAATVQAENTVRFIIRYRAGITPAMRIVFRGQPYRIISVDNKKYRNSYLEIKGVLLDAGGN